MKDYFMKLTPSGSFLDVTYSQWLHILFSILTAVLLYYGLKLFIKLIDTFLFKKTSFSFKVLESLRGPLSIFIATAYLKISETSIGLEGATEDIWLKGTSVIFSAAVFWALYCIVEPFSSLLAKAAEKTESDLDDQLVPLITKTSRILIIVLGFLTILQGLGLNVFSLIAGLGIGGLALALAAKDTAANFFGSLMILFDQPFKRGDWIKVDEIEGTVTEIGFRSTRIKTFYDSEVVIPNSTVANANIDNMGRRKYRRVFTHLNLTYSTTKEQMNQFTKGVRDIINSHELTRKDKLHVNFNNMGESSLDVLLYYFITVNTYEGELKTKEEILISIMELARKLKVDFAFPSRSLYIESNNSDSNVF